MPLHPQPEETLRRRYADALMAIYDLREFMEQPTPTPPSHKPVHVFDTLDGLRLIVSRERTPHGQLVTHFSASFHPQCAEELQKIRQVLSPEDALAFIVRRWREISGDQSSEAEFIGLTDKRIPHWFVKAVH